MLSILADSVAGSAASQTAVESMKTPFLPGRVVSAYIMQNGMTGTVPSIIIEGSNTSATTGFTDLLECDQIHGGKVGDVVMYKWMRLRVATAPGTVVGRLSAWLSSGD